MAHPQQERPTLGQRLLAFLRLGYRLEHQSGHQTYRRALFLNASVDVQVFQSTYFSGATGYVVVRLVATKPFGTFDTVAGTVGQMVHL